MKDGRYFLRGSLPSTPLPTQEQPPWGETEVVGKALPRIDAYERVSGSAIYPSDVTLPRMLHGAILRCPHPHARVKRVETAAAEKLPGVHAVISNAAPGAGIPWRHSSRGPETRLFDPHCRHEGDEVAAVAAETPYQARDALRAIDVEYETLPFVVDPEEALEADAPRVHEEANAVDPLVYERGDVAAGLAGADVVIEESYRTPCELHTPMEPHGSVARWDGNRLTVWESTQGVYAVQNELARVFDLPLGDVRVIGHYVGGGFGSKLQLGKYTVIAALLARRSARPVRLFLSREETMLCVGNRPAAVMRLKAGVTREGKLTALDLVVTGSGGAYSAYGTGLVDWQLRDLYHCENVRSVQHNAYTHAGTLRPMRAPGHPQGSWALEQMLDALARRIGMDPVELRLRNLPESSQGREGIPYTSNGYGDCLREGARAFGWSEARRRGEDEGPLLRGVGMAGCTWVVGDGGPPATAIVKLFADGSVNLNLGASDIGTGTKTVMAMVVAEELGLTPERVQVEHADTATTQFATPSGGSKTVPTESPAVRAAAIDCRNQVLAMAARQLELPPGELRLKDGAVLSRANEETRLEISAIEEFRRTMLVVGIGYRGPNPEGKAICPFAAQFCEVEVNRRTGEVRLLRFVAAHDSGRVMNRMTYENQVCGGITMGIGLGMTERRVLDGRQTGKMVNRSWHEYKIPTAMDVPGEIVTVPIDPGDVECNTTGAKGLGEPVTIPTAAAIANAVRDATGLRVTDAPINPTRLVELLAGRRAAKKEG
jgi:xanthine dehydrogenase YagR molybdenum-binding subunit